MINMKNTREYSKHSIFSATKTRSIFNLKEKGNLDSKKFKNKANNKCIY